eukprot:1410200-Lingulodinium_polyedra.AAC.1
MLLELDSDELATILDSDDRLGCAVTAAVRMLESHSAGRPQLAAATLQGNLRLGAPTFSPSQD